MWCSLVHVLSVFFVVSLSPPAIEQLIRGSISGRSVLTSCALMLAFTVAHLICQRRRLRAMRRDVRLWCRAITAKAERDAYFRSVAKRAASSEVAP